ncbi:MAG: hypothetical protein ACXWIO_05180 [Croceibacterium sp.]
MRTSTPQHPRNKAAPVVPCYGWYVTPETLADACALLELDPSAHDALGARLHKIAEDFMRDALDPEFIGAAKEQKRAIDQLARALGRTFDCLDGIKSGYQGTLQELAGRDPYVINFSRLQKDILRLQEACEEFHRAYKPHKGPTVNLGLERAVRALLEIIEREMDRSVTITWNKLNTKAPAPRSKAAKALVMLVQAIIRGTPTTTVLNMIEKVRKQPFETPSPIDRVFDVAYLR